MPTTVLIVDDHPIIRAGVASIISASAEMEVIGLARNGEEALKLFHRHTPDIVLLDLRLPGISGLETLKRICERDASARVIILSIYEGNEDIYQAMQTGAKGYLPKGCPPEMLLSGIRTVCSGGIYLPSAMSRALSMRTRDRCLSPRERSVLQLLSEGKSNRGIAESLGLRESTVKCHISVILTRLDAADRTQAVMIGLQRGLIHLDTPA
jgi:DNA-binding NarL/FixJ family response regulator